MSEVPTVETTNQPRPPEKKPHLLKKIDWTKKEELTPENFSIYWAGATRGIRINEQVKVAGETTIRESCGTLALGDEWEATLIPVAMDGLFVARVSVTKDDSVVMYVNEKLFSDDEAVLEFLRPEICRMYDLAETTSVDELKDKVDTSAAIKTITQSIMAHEMYHVRQQYQDKDYYDQTAQDNQKGKAAYTLSQGERAANAFGLRYLVEQKKQLEKFAEQTPETKAQIDAINRSITSGIKHFMETVPFAKELSSGEFWTLTQKYLSTNRDFFQWFEEWGIDDSKYEEEVMKHDPYQHEDP